MKILVVGLGLIAQRHIRNLKAIDSSIEIAVWRQRPDPPGWQPPDVPVDRWLYSLAEVQSWQPGAAVIANPASLHASTGASLAALGAHLFVEKPISVLPHRAAGLVCLTRPGRVLMVGYDLRFYRPLQLVKAAIDEGRIGRPLSIRCEVGQYLPDWRPGRDYRTSVSARSELGGGVLLELSHEIDYARWLMGEVASVSAMTGRLSDLEIDVEDTADIVMRFASGAMGNIHMDMVDRYPVRRCRVVGTEGTLECNMVEAAAWFLPPGGPPECLSMVRWAAGEPEPESPFLAEMRHFLACCRGEASPPVDGIEGARVLAIALAAKKAAEERREAEVGA